MQPVDTGRAYDRIAAWWAGQDPRNTTGLAYVDRAIALCARKGTALDVGCGTGRMLGHLRSAGFQVTGLDVSPGMLGIARSRQPGVRLVEADVTTWTPDQAYDLVVAWDSTFHVPKDLQATAVARLCDALAPQGVLLFTAGGRECEAAGTMQGQRFEYASLADQAYLDLLQRHGCDVALAEHDQEPEPHAIFIAVKRQ